MITNYVNMTVKKHETNKTKIINIFPIRKILKLKYYFHCSRYNFDMNRTFIIWTSTVITKNSCNTNAFHLKLEQSKQNI